MVVLSDASMLSNASRSGNYLHKTKSILLSELILSAINIQQTPDSIPYFMIFTIAYLGSNHIENVQGIFEMNKYT